jgi:toxin ParE1/3/4
VRITWSPLALERVGDIAEWIARNSAPAAERWVEEVFASVRHLERFPQSGRAVPELSRIDIREVLHGPYRVIYRIEPDQVAVLTVRHGRRLLRPEDLEP